MIGDRVFATAFPVVLIFYWIGYWTLPESLALPLPETLLSHRVTNAIALAATASIALALYYAGVRKEADAVEVFRPYGLVLIGGAIFIATFSYPWLFFNEAPKGHIGVTARHFQMGINESPYFSLYIAAFLSLGSFGLYLLVTGVKGFFAELTAKSR